LTIAATVNTDSILCLDGDFITIKMKHRLLADPFLKVACCVDSLPHFEPNYFDNKNIILDEACLLFPPTVCSHCCRQECKETA